MNQKPFCPCRNHGAILCAYVCMWVCVWVVPVSMWSTELNMWSDVRGKLLTLRPLSVLSLREWALHKNRQKHSFVPDHHLVNSRNEQQKVPCIIMELTFHENIFHENGWQINTFCNWKETLQMLWAGQPYGGGSKRKKDKKIELCG